MTRSAPMPSLRWSRWITRCLALALAAGLASLALGTASAGCGPACDTSGQDPVPYADGLRPSPDSYESTDPNGTWLHYPPGRRFRFMHGLGTANVTVDTRLAFDSHPLSASGSVGNSSPGTGNSVIIEAQTPDYVQIRNDTCAEYYLWVVIRRVGSTSASDAGTD